MASSCFIITIVSRYSKMIMGNQQVAVHLKTLRNLTGYTSGRYALRLSLHAPSSTPARLEAVPVNIIERDPPKSDNRSEFDERHYVSRTFLLKSGLNVELNEVCLFKVNAPVYSSGEEWQVELVCELVQMEQGKARVVEGYRGRLLGLALHEYMEVDFYEAPAQLVGSVHSCNYKYDFSMDDQPITLKNYCERYCKFDVEDLLAYLQAECVKNYKTIATNYTLITKKEANAMLVDREAIEKTLQSKKSQKNLSLKVIQREEKEEDNKETQQTEMDEDVNTSPVLGEKRKRRRIFGVTQEGKVSKYDTCERILHEYAQKIYEFWREIVAVLVREEGDRFVALRGESYRQSLKEKVGQSIARFKGSWDVDIYCDEEQMRAKLAYQLRNQDNQFFKDMKSPQTSPFPVINTAFFSNVRPIFFEEVATNGEGKGGSEPQEILVIMVHGLGACRLDMEKIKVELRRYYDKRVRIYISTSNEGRTEGDIENMGMRLATQIEYELSKYEKIPPLCLLGHSMGGVIIRTALPRLQKFKEHFHALITLSSPHLGYAYSASKLVDAGLWLMNTMKKCTSILQLTMQDSEQVEESFLFKLSKRPGLEWFRKVVLLASHQDLYVPYYSARIQKHEESSLELRRNIRRGVVYCEMIDSLLSKCRAQIIRLNVNFCIPEQNIDNLIGRAAHISFINNVEMVRTLVLAGTHYFF